MFPHFYAINTIRSTSSSPRLLALPSGEGVSIQSRVSLLCNVFADAEGCVCFEVRELGRFGFFEPRGIFGSFEARGMFGCTSRTVSYAKELTSVYICYPQGDGFDTPLSRLSYALYAHVSMLVC